MNEPIDISPEITEFAPNHTTPATPQNIRAMTTAVSIARTLMRASAAANDASIALRKRPSRSFSMP
jgi:hypothetical protein